jgi:hypothetical protein
VAAAFVYTMTAIMPAYASLARPHTIMSYGVNYYIDHNVYYMAVAPGRRAEVFRTTFSRIELRSRGRNVGQFTEYTTAVPIIMEIVAGTATFTPEIVSADLVQYLNIFKWCYDNLEARPKVEELRKAIEKKITEDIAVVTALLCPCRPVDRAGVLTKAGFDASDPLFAPCSACDCRSAAPAYPNDDKYVYLSSACLSRALPVCLRFPRYMRMDNYDLDELEEYIVYEIFGGDLPRFTEMFDILHIYEYGLLFAQVA